MRANVFGSRTEKFKCLFNLGAVLTSANSTGISLCGRPGDGSRDGSGDRLGTGLPDINGHDNRPLRVDGAGNRGIIAAIKLLPFEGLNYSI